ncbi:glutamate 5-kinase [Enterococcus diestrammenae]|uniref:Glutamate 5-kinase n=1 Tax=Enterococcus diestrammenae TaxID=1155073 RepID=A0ABV0F0C0_9ENTE|nr:glutamate 5-kinase [Enterococcus diestrammenae]KAF1298365.1 glutamate 5-kinase [Enterococcus diestrammenae]
MRGSLATAKRIVIKIGTSSLIYPNGNINLSGIDQLAFVLTDLANQGKEIILVSSGAIGVGMYNLGLAQRPISIPEQQAVAAVGQTELMTIYTQRFMTYSQKTAQVLLTRDIVEFPESRKNVINTLNQLLAMHIIPIINENDTVAVEELDHQTKFGDNDQLSAIVTQLTNADLLIMLSDIDGFYSDNPTVNHEAVLYQTVHEITGELMAKAGGKGSQFGTGGMVSKLKAAQRILAADSKMVLANGEKPQVIFAILAGDAIGTLFCNQGKVEKG